MSIDVLLSIKPVFAKAIFSGKKIYEFRKSVFKDMTIRKVYVYASAPISMVIGVFYIEEIIKHHPGLLWAETSQGAGITEAYFNEYFADREVGYALKVQNAQLFDEPKCLDRMFGIQYPPQSFRYVSSLTEEFV